MEVERIDIQINSKLENRNRKFSMGSDNPNTLGSDKHIKAPGLSDPTGIQVRVWLVVLLREHVFRDWKYPTGSDYPMLRKNHVGQSVGWCTRENVFVDGKRIGWSNVGFTVRRTNWSSKWSSAVVLEFKFSAAPDDPTLYSRIGRINTSGEWHQHWFKS